MDLLALLFISVGLSMDLFAVSIAVSISMKQMKRVQIIRMATSFAIFHVVMITLGYLLGFGMLEIVSGIDHWVAFGLLVFVGARMIYESFGEEDIGKGADPTRGRQLFILSVATSIDALALGISFAFLHTEMLLTLVVVGVVVFCFGVLGCLIGPRIGKVAGKYAEILGGVVLIILAFKILLEHVL